MNKNIIIITLITVMIIITGCSNNIPTCPYKEVATPIKSLETGNTMSGSFIVGIGGFSTTPKYYVYLAKDNGWILTTYNAETIKLVEDDNNYPAYVTYTLVTNGGYCKIDLTTNTDEYLRVPSNTIKMNYDTTIGGTK